MFRILRWQILGKGICFISLRRCRGKLKPTAAGLSWITFSMHAMVCVHVPLGTRTPRVYAWRACMHGPCTHTIATMWNVNKFGLERATRSGKQWARYKESIALLRCLQALAAFECREECWLGDVRVQVE